MYTIILVLLILSGVGALTGAIHHFIYDSRWWIFWACGGLSSLLLCLGLAFYWLSEPEEKRCSCPCTAEHAVVVEPEHTPIPYPIFIGR